MYNVNIDALTIGELIELTEKPPMKRMVELLDKCVEGGVLNRKPSELTAIAQAVGESFQATANPKAMTA